MSGCLIWVSQCLGVEWQKQPSHVGFPFCFVSRNLHTTKCRCVCSRTKNSVRVKSVKIQFPPGSSAFKKIFFPVVNGYTYDVCVIITIIISFTGLLYDLNCFSRFFSSQSQWFRHYVFVILRVPSQLSVRYLLALSSPFVVGTLHMSCLAVTSLYPLLFTKSVVILSML